MEKEKEDIEDKKVDIKMSEKQIDAIYFYLNMNINTMSDDELVLWHHIMENIDKDFNDD